MSIYDIACHPCGITGQVELDGDEFFDKWPSCDCGRPFRRQRFKIEAPHRLKVAEIYEYQSIIDGMPINSRHAHREHMKRHNLMELGNEKPGQYREPRKTDWKESLGQAYAELKVTGHIHD